MVVKLIWSQLAIDDLDDIANFIAKDTEEYAKIFVRKIVEQVERISDFPLLGRVVPEIQDDSIAIVRIFHHERQLKP